MMRKARITAVRPALAVTQAHRLEERPQGGSANAGSPSQPNPRLASVMPSWQAAR